MTASENQTSKSGIVTDANGERHIPSSTRADGTTRREIKIRPGYRPPEDVEVYKHRTAEAFRSRGKGGIPGADAAEDQDKAGSAPSNKNAKRREARRKAKAAAEGESDNGTTAGKNDDSAKGSGEAKNGIEELQTATAALTVDPEADKEKKVKKLKKKLREARELQQKKERGEGLLPEQLQKAIRINEIVRELDQLGFDEEGEPKGD